MATNLEFVEYVCDQIDGVGAVRYKKMFGEYMVYVNEKPIVSIKHWELILILWSGLVNIFRGGHTEAEK